MTLPTEYRRQLFYFLGGSGVYAGIIGLLYFDWLLIGPYLTVFVLAAAVAATLAPVRRVVHHYIHVIHDTPAKQRTNYIVAALATLLITSAVLHIPFDLNMSHYIVIALVAALCVAAFTLPSIMDRDTLTAMFIISTMFVILITLGVLVGNALVNETQIAVQYTQKLIERNQGTIERLKDKDNVVVDAMHYCEKGVKYAMDLHLPNAVYTSVQLDKQSPSQFCSDKVTFVRDNAQTYIQKVQTLAQEHAGAAGSHVAGLLGDVFGSIASLPMQSVVFSLLLFYFVQYEPRIRAEIWKLSPFSASETTALVHAINEKVSKTIGQSMLKSTGGFWITYLAFQAAGFQISLIFAFIAGALELTPFTSPFLVWIPSLLASAALNGLYSYKTPVMLVLYLFDLLVVNSQISKLFNIREQNPTVMSMSILLGAGAFGPAGVVLALITTGMSLVVLDMYKKYCLGEADAVEKTIESQKPSELATKLGASANIDPQADISKHDKSHLVDKPFSETKEEQRAARDGGDDGRAAGQPRSRSILSEKDVPQYAHSTATDTHYTNYNQSKN